MSNVLQNGNPPDLVRQAELQKLRQMQRHLQSATMLPGCKDKRFITDIWQRDPAALTAKQVEHLTRLAWRYRRQMPKDLVPASDPDWPPVPEARRHK